MRNLISKLWKYQLTARSGLVVALLFSATSSGKDHPPLPSPEIEFKVLLIIKKRTEAWSPLFLPVRAEMSEAEITTARHCFDVETPEMVRDITGGRVRFVPSVHVSEKPLRYWDPDRRDSAEILKEEMFAEFSRIAEPGQYDSVGYYFLPRDPNTGYSIPRAGYGVGWFDGARAVGAFAVHAAEMNPRDEIFLHEWIHGLEQFYNGKPGVRLPDGWLHGGSNYEGYQEEVYRPGGTFRGWMDWYKDFLNREVKEDDGLSGLGSAAWKHGPMRDTQPRRFPAPEKPADLGAYPDWLFSLMDGDLANAKLGADLLDDASEEPDDELGPWNVERWGSGDDTKVERRCVGDVSAIRIRSREADDVKVNRRVRLEPFKNYVFSAEVKVRGVEIVQEGGRFGVTIAAGSNRSPKLIEGSCEWSPVTICFTTGENPNGTELQLRLGGRGSLAEGEVRFRNPRLQEILYPSYD